MSSRFIPTLKPLGTSSSFQSFNGVLLWASWFKNKNELDKTPFVFFRAQYWVRDLIPYTIYSVLFNLTCIIGLFLITHVTRIMTVN